MRTPQKKEYTLEGLCCTNCASAIERESAKIEGVESAVVDFVSRKLVLYTHESETTMITEAAKGIVKRIEPHVQFMEVMPPIRMEVGATDHDRNHDHGTDHGRALRFRFGLSALFYLAALLPVLPDALDLPLYVIAYLLAGYNVLKSAFTNLIHGRVFDENFLMTIATFGAFAIGELEEAVGVMLFFQIGEILQDIAVGRSRKSIAALMDIRPEFAQVLRNGSIEKVSPEVVQIGDRILVKPGERIPLDGTVIDGTSSLDTAALTGESMPKVVTTGDDVQNGVINLQGLLTIEVTKLYEDSTVAKILNLVENASLNKAKTETFMTKFARVYTPIVVFAAAAVALIPPFVLQIGSFSEWLYRALVFLVVSCPCALVVSIPLGYFGGIGGASKKGILIKGGQFIEALANLETIIFDKTGTLTEGHFTVTRLIPADGVSEDSLLQWAALGEHFSTHPIAKSIVNAYARPIDVSNVIAFEEIPGRGTECQLNDQLLHVGNASWMKEKNISVDEVPASGTIIYVAYNGQYLGAVEIQDRVKRDAAESIRWLKASGVKNAVLLTGDSQSAADKVKQELGLDQAFGNLLPQDKVAQLEHWLEGTREKGKGKTAFVGDGINDAPVLARADVGIAMGGVGSDAAIEASDVVLMTDEPSKIVTAIRIAKKTKRIIWQNIIIALGIKLVIMVLGAFGVATLWEAVFGDVGVALIAVMNSMRAMKFQE